MTPTIPFNELCMFLPYGLEFKVVLFGREGYSIGTIECMCEEYITFKDSPDWYFDTSWNDTEIKPIVRPLSSMTYNERCEVEKIDVDYMFSDLQRRIKSIQWYLSHHFDIYNWVEKNLAIEKV